MLDNLIISCSTDAVFIQNALCAEALQPVHGRHHLTFHHIGVS
jgi:hypothetical protein